MITLSIVVVVVLLVYHFRRKRRNKQTQPSGNAVNHSKYKIDDMAKPKQNVGIVPDSSKTYPTYEIASLNTTAPPVGTPPPVYNIPVVGGRPITPRNPTMPPLPPQQNQ
ncbi:unnamed protein product [Trichobilharzia regenti]|nr:unnamed protein product [Trichobilharzia regenti]